MISKQRRIVAEAFLKHRSRNMLRTGDREYIDTSLVTNVEYQLFLDEMMGSEKFYQPDHWIDYEYEAGTGLEPILGIRQSDADAFCNWLTHREGGFWRYRTANKYDNVSMFPNSIRENLTLESYDKFINTALTTPEFDRTLIRVLDLSRDLKSNRTNDLERTLNRDLQRALNRSNNFTSIISLDDYIIAENFPLNMDFAEQTKSDTLEIALASALEEVIRIDRELARIKELSKDINFRDRLIRALKTARKRFSPLARNTNYSLDRARDLARILAFNNLGDLALHLLRDQQISLTYDLISTMEENLNKARSKIFKSITAIVPEIELPSHPPAMLVTQSTYDILAKNLNPTLLRNLESKTYLVIISRSILFVEILADLFILLTIAKMNEISSRLGKTLKREMIDFTKLLSIYDGIQARILGLSKPCGGILLVREN